MTAGPKVRSTQPVSLRPRILRWLTCFLVCIGLILIAGAGVLYFAQHMMIYHPRPYDDRYAHVLPSNGVELQYSTAAGKQCAFYLQRGETTSLPKRLWVAFCGNGSLALDWTRFIARDRNSEDAFLLIDYPGYGKNEGYATIDSTRASADKALDVLADHLGVPEKDVEARLNVIGHSLGSAVALDFAARHPVQRVVAIAPFTTLREEAATIVGTPLSHLLIENYDNRLCLTVLARRSLPPRIALFHGTNDQDIPVRMSRALAKDFPNVVEFFPISGADHMSVISTGSDAILAWMKQ